MRLNSNEVSRRKVVQAMASGAGAMALAGCTGTGGGSTSDGGGGNGETTESSTGSGGDSGGMPKVQLAGTGFGDWGTNRRKSFYDPYRNGETPYSKEHKLEFSAVHPEKYLSSILQTPKSPGYDLVELDNGRSPLLGKAGALINQKEEIDNWSNLDEEFRNEWVGGTTLAPWGLAWNNDMVDRDKFTSWDDLIDPALEGKTGLWAWNSAGHKIFYAINAVKGGSLDNVEPGVKWLKEFVDTTDPVIFDNGATAQKMLSQGEVAAAPFLQAWATRVSLNSDGDVPVEWAVPEEGAWTDYWGYPQMKHRSDERVEAAKEFLEGAYTKEAQAKFADLTGYPPAISDSTDLISDETKENYPNIVLSDEQISRLSALNIDWVEVQSTKAEHAQEWRKVISG